MTDTRTYTTTRTDNPVEFDEVDMSGSDSMAELRRTVHEVTRQQLRQTRQQLAEAMTMCAELSAELEDTKHLRDAWKAEAMEARAERAQLVEALAEANAQAEIYRNERDAQRRIWLNDSKRMAQLKDMQGAGVRFMLDALQRWQAEMDALRAERDEANRRADDAVASLEAYSVAKARLRGMGWWC